MCIYIHIYPVYLFGGRDLRHSGVQDVGYKDLGLWCLRVRAGWAQGLLLG